jgi:hypothetical protein
MKNKKNSNENISNNPELAEILGVFIGDGWIQSNKRGLFVAGSPSEDKLHYDNYLAPLFSKYFANVKPRNFPYLGVYGIGIYKKRLIEKAINYGFQIGPKSLIAEIPINVLQSKNNRVLAAVIRGIFPM